MVVETLPQFGEESMRAQGRDGSRPGVVGRTRSREPWRVAEDRLLSGSLAFHTYYASRTRDRIYLFLSRMAEGLPCWMSSKAFHPVPVAVHALDLGAFLYQLGDHLVGEPDNES